MITLKESARKELESYFAGKDKESIRVYLAAGGWQGSRLVLALDGPSEDDQTFDVDGFPFCINKELLKTVGGVTIDLTYMGFTIEPDIPLAKQESSCGGSCSSGSCSI